MSHISMMLKQNETHQNSPSQITDAESQENLQNFTSLICKYYDKAHHTYLTRRFSESQGSTLEHNNNFILKDSLLKSNSEAQSEETHESNSDNEDSNQLSIGEPYEPQPPQMESSQLMNFNISQISLMDIGQINQRPRFNSINYMNMEDVLKMRALQCGMFSTNEKNPRKGWICSICKNFNYETRIRCNRCKKNKGAFNGERSVIDLNGNCGINEIKSKVKGGKQKKKTQFLERDGDWTCVKCRNLNFAFRTACNRCQLTKKESIDFMKLFCTNTNTNTNYNENNIIQTEKNTNK